jgi:hypothetical protein
VRQAGLEPSRCGSTQLLKSKPTPYRESKHETSLSIGHRTGGSFEGSRAPYEHVVPQLDFLALILRSRLQRRVQYVPAHSGNRTRGVEANEQRLSRFSGSFAASERSGPQVEAPLDWSAGRPGAGAAPIIRAHPVVRDRRFVFVEPVVNILQPVIEEGAPSSSRTIQAPENRASRCACPRMRESTAP